MGIWAGGSGVVVVRRGDLGPRRSGRQGGRGPVGGVEQAEPGILPGPVFGQVQGDVAAAVPGQPGRDPDEVSADGGAAGFGVERRGEGSGGAEQVVGERGQGQPGGLRLTPR